MMTGDDTPTTSRVALAAAGAAVTVFVLSLVAGAVLASGTAPAAAASPTPTPTPTPTPDIDDRAGMYENATSTPAQDAWLAGREDPTLENVVGLAGRFGGFVVGTPEGGTLVGGALMVGLIVGGMAIGALAQPSTGSVGAGVAALVLLWGLGTTGYAPLWLYAVGLMLLGLLAGAAIIRGVR